MSLIMRGGGGGTGPPGFTTVHFILQYTTYLAAVP